MQRRDERRLTKWVIVVALCIPVPLVVIGMAILGGTMYLARFHSDTRSANALVGSFVNEAASGEMDLAYSRISARYRATGSYTEFCKRLERYGPLLSRLALGPANYATHETGKEGRLLVNMFTGSPRYFCVRVVNEDGVWKVDEFASSEADGGLEGATRMLLESADPLPRAEAP